MLIHLMIFSIPRNSIISTGDLNTDLDYLNHQNLDLKVRSIPLLYVGQSHICDLSSTRVDEFCENNCDIGERNTDQSLVVA